MMRSLPFALVCLLSIAATPLQARASARSTHAVHLLRSGHIAEATELLRAAFAADPKNATLATDLAFAEQLGGRAEEAERLFHRAIELDPHRWYAYANLASMKAAAPLGASDRDALIALLERGLSLQKNRRDRTGRAGILLAMGDVERAAGNLGAARGRLVQAQERDQALTSGQARRAAALGQAIDAALAKHEDARSIEPWPEPPIAPELIDQLRLGNALLARDPQAALREAERLSAIHRTWRGPRWLRARALIALEQLDAGTRELESLLRLNPADASAWRLLGETLANHGGPFEADRADAALQRALSLEPAWSELWEIRARLLFRSGRAADALPLLLREENELRTAGETISPEVEALLTSVQAQANAAAKFSTEAKESPAPTPMARTLFREAQEFVAAGNLTDANDRLTRALADSPSLIDAASLRLSLFGIAPEETARALWNDPAQLLRLAAAVREEAVAQALQSSEAPPEAASPLSSEGAPTPANSSAASVKALESDGGVAPAKPWLEERAVDDLVRPWIERAASLGDALALLQRAHLRAGAEGANGANESIEKNAGGAIDVAGALEDLGAAVAAGLSPERLDEARALRARLSPARGDDRAASLSLPCAAESDPARSLAQGVAYDLAGDLALAIGCYQAVLARAPGDVTALTRLSRAAARAPIAQVRPLATLLDRAAAANISSACLARARLFAAEGRRDEALAEVDRFFAASPAPGFIEPGLAEARALQASLWQEREKSGAARQSRWKIGMATILAVAIGLAIAALLFFSRGLTVAHALHRDASLFPAVARAVAEIRHDALKHRASALSMLGSAPREEVQRALSGERPASALIDDAYTSVVKSARARGIALRSLAREPAFGPLFLDLQAAEEQLAQPAGSKDARITAIADRMHMHGERLAALLKLGPRTRLDAAQLARWIEAAEGELRAKGQAWSSPALQLQGLELDFPVAPEALSAIFANLLRNAQAAAQRSTAPRVLVRVSEERDAAGRRVLELHIGDSSSEPLSLEQIEGRESGRGLSLVRDLVREWQGHLRVRAEESPWQKSIAACFPS